MGRPRVYTVNESYFDSMTDNSAYLIGLIMADGTIQHDRFSISAKHEDASFLSCIAKELGSNRPLQHVVHPAGRVVRMCINSSKIANRLYSFGIHSPRTLTAKTHISLIGNRDYWRGIIDGDGSFCISKRGSKILRLVGSSSICSEFLWFCRENNAGRNISVCRHKSIFTVCLNGEEALSMSSVLYSSAKLFLLRKMNIYLNWINGGCHVSN